MSLPTVDNDYLIKFLVDLLNTPSPTGYTEEAIEFCRQAFSQFPQLNLSINNKGALLAEWLGRDSTTPRGLTAHVDTLGAMVKEIKPSGRLQISRLGGLLLPGVESEGCTVFTRRGDPVRGSLLIDAASVHVYGKDAQDRPRNEEHMEVRLDALTHSAAETRDLGIQVGDFIAFDPRVELTNGFVRSRFLDDKACVACLAAAIHGLHTAGLTPTQDAYFHISNYEEVGHGAAAGLPDSLTELISVDMAAVGDGQTSDETHATLCVKDSGGPYHHGLSNRLRDLAEQHGIDYKVDIYPYYASDGEAYWRAGGDVAVALIGPGVDASHNYERTHTSALVATTQWIMAYLLS